ncbi:MAG: PLD nuclease N-terminal domain-containing protein [Anaerolineales bacterium]
MITALVDLIRRQQTRGPKWAWVLVIVLINLLGPIIYFIAGRKEDLE